MKPNIDLKSPEIQLFIQKYKDKINVALNVPQTVEKSVIPIYSVPKTKGHQKPKEKPEQIGSGVLVNIDNTYFIFSATHVFLEFGQYQIITGDGGGNPVQILYGERFSTGKIDLPGKDIYDASVFHVQSELSESLKAMAITPEDFDFSQFVERKHNQIYISAGFRIKKSNTSGNKVNSKREGYASIELTADDYIKLKFDPKTHIALSYEQQVLVNDNWSVAPIPQGMSGGAIIRVSNLKIDDSLQQNTELRQLLSAIIIEHHKEKRGVVPGALIGTRINVYLGLIHQYMPEVIKKIVTQQNSS